MLVVLLAHQISSETTLCQYPSLPLLLIQIQIKYYQRRAKHQAMQTLQSDNNHQALLSYRGPTLAQPVL